MTKLRFRYFIAPFHRAGTNPTPALQRDLEFIEHLDAVDYDEVWLGEHHSAGRRSSVPRRSSSPQRPSAKRIRFEIAHFQKPRFRDSDRADAR